MKKTARKPTKTSVSRTRKPNIKASGLKSPEQWLVDWVRGGQPPASGEFVSEVTALGLTAYLACIKNISEDIAKLPLSIFKNLSPRGRQPVPNHPLQEILRYEPNPEMSALTFRETLTQHALGWHGGFAEIIRDNAGRVMQLWPLDPTSVQPYRFDGQLFYRVRGITMAADDIFHLHGLGYNGVTGYCLAYLVKDPIGNALAAQTFSGAFFGNGTSTSGTIEVPDAMSETAFKHLRESFFERHSGRNQWKPIILEEGAKWNAISTDPQKSQLIEAIHNGVEEVCRLFRMPPHKIQHLLRATFSNIEMQAIEYVKDCLLGWGERWEQEIRRKLLLPREKAQGLFASHNFDMLLQGDTPSRTAYYQVRFNIGSLSPNDIREKENENPIEGGDTYFVNSALIPLDMAAEGLQLPQKAAQTSPDANTNVDGNGKPQNLERKRDLLARVAAAHRDQIALALKDVLRYESDVVGKREQQPRFRSFLGEFYGPDRQRQVEARLSPSLMALSGSLEAIVNGKSHG